MRLTDFRWYVASCGEPAGLSWPDPHGGRVYAKPERKGFILPGYSWAESEAIRRMCWTHRQIWHPETLYLD